MAELYRRQEERLNHSIEVEKIASTIELHEASLLKYSNFRPSTKALANYESVVPLFGFTFKT